MSDETVRPMPSQPPFTTIYSTGSVDHSWVDDELHPLDMVFGIRVGGEIRYVWGASGLLDASFAQFRDFADLSMEARESLGDSS